MFDDWPKLISYDPWLKYVAEIAFFLLAAWAIHQFLLAWLRRFSKRTLATLDDDLAEILDRALRPILILTALDASLNLFDLPRKLLNVLNRVLYLAILVFALYYATKTVQVLLEHFLSKSSAHPRIGNSESRPCQEDFSRAQGRVISWALSQGAVARFQNCRHVGL
jgi:hypothetical protein